MVPRHKVLLADAEGTLAHVEVGGFGAAMVQRFSREQPGVVPDLWDGEAVEMVE